MIGLARSFKIMDDNNSKTLELCEFQKAMRDYGLGFSASEIDQLYAVFDVNGDGSIDYDEFIRMVRGPMNDRRKKIVLKAFNKLDKDNSGTLEINDIRDVYNASKHPDVASGKKTEDDILMEFLQTFEVHHNTMAGGQPDSYVTKEEFCEYYNNISSSIDNDQYFELMMNTAWKLQDNPGYAGWSNGEPGSIAFKKAPRPSHPYPAEAMVTASQDIGKAKGGFNFTKGDRPIDIAVDKFRQRLIKRGVRGFIGLQRVFKIMDDDNSKNLNMYEFSKACKDFRVDLTQDEVQKVFEHFDVDGSGSIDYDEFLRGIRGPMNDFRKMLAAKAFKIMDKDGSGNLDISDIKGVYNAKFHPDVKAGKMTEDEVLTEFLETFESHHAVRTGGHRDSNIT
jgi:Ca2+-binding EF-hand superfamily protein